MTRSAWPEHPVTSVKCRHLEPEVSGGDTRVECTRHSFGRCVLGAPVRTEVLGCTGECASSVTVLWLWIWLRVGGNNTNRCVSSTSEMTKMCFNYEGEKGLWEKFQGLPFCPLPSCTCHLLLLLLSQVGTEGPGCCAGDMVKCCSGSLCLRLSPWSLQGTNH